MKAGLRRDDLAGKEGQGLTSLDKEMQTTNFSGQFSNVGDALALAQAIVDTVHEPVLVLDSDLRVIAASRSFYAAFKVSPDETQGRLLYKLGNGQWDIAKLRVLLEQIIPEQKTIQDYEVEHFFPDLGDRVMCLNARQVLFEGGAKRTVLLGIEDVTERRARERDLADLLRQKEILLGELEHRVANSLQIIASIILMKARGVESEETRDNLLDAHKRIVSIAAVQKELHPSAFAGQVEMAPYLSRLCEALSASIMGGVQAVTLEVAKAEGSTSARDAESLGLIATELVMNSLKHAFPAPRQDGRIRVAFEVKGADWKFSVADNGIGRSDGVFAQKKTGLGTGIVKALAQQLEATVETTADANGTTVCLTHATFAKRQEREVQKPDATLEKCDADERLTTVNAS